MKHIRSQNFICPLICLSILLFAFGTYRVQGATNTNDVIQASSASLKKILYELNRVPGPRATFWDRLAWQIEQNGPRNSQERFGYSMTFMWTKWQIEGIGPEKAEHHGEGVFGDTISDSFIDAFTPSLNLNQFKGSGSPGLSFGARFIEGTLNTIEPHLRSDTIIPDEVGITERWIASFREDWEKHGVNLINNNPYFFASIAPLKNKQGIPYFILDTRVRMMFLSSRIGMPRVDEQLLIPVNQETQVSLGCRFYPTKFDQEDWKPSYTVRITHEIGGVTSGNILYASIQIDGERLFLIGVSLNQLFNR